MAVKLSWGDPFLVSHAEDKEGPIAVYAEGRRKGHFRKVRAWVGGLCAGSV